MAGGKTARDKGIRQMNRLARELTEATGRKHKRKLEEYRLANNGDVAEELRLENGELVQKPLPLLHEAKKGDMSRGEWISALYEATEAAAEWEVPVGWVHADGRGSVPSLRFAILWRVDFEAWLRALQQEGVWPEGALPWHATKMSGTRPRWREKLQELSERESSLHQVLLLRKGGQRPLDAALVPEEDALELVKLAARFGCFPQPRGEVPES